MEKWNLKSNSVSSLRNYKTKIVFTFTNTKINYAAKQQTKKNPMISK